MSLENARVVLVRTEVPGNLGATARVMRNFGLNRLILVSPVADPAAREARQMSTHGEGILKDARIVSTLEEAFHDCVIAVATSARFGGLFRQQNVGTPGQILPHLLEPMRSSSVALVFGPEPSGLTNEELSRCHYCIHIPSDPVYPALNLAQAVAITLYELRQAWLKQAPDDAATEIATAPFSEQERMFAELRTALEEIHFLFGPKAESLFHGIRHLLGRAQPTSMEVKLLHGLARQIRWHVREHPRQVQVESDCPEGQPPVG